MIQLLSKTTWQTLFKSFENRSSYNIEKADQSEASRPELLVCMFIIKPIRNYVNISAHNSVLDW